MSKRKYLVKKIADAEEPLDVTVDAKKFDNLVTRLLESKPLPLSQLRKEPGRLAARRSRKAEK